ncbi:MAG: hypothetical protein HQL14_08035 [Candidatus Omnitrophica bacterium]|nr:hypothetical protein [Candidatus Omnitrophota bacterium]
MTDSFKERLKRILSNDYYVALFFLIAYLCTNSYGYGWDNQHLEIPLLKHLIDPSLYKGDYYVESLARNFTSYLYPIMARFITVEQVPAAYLVLFLIFRYLIFFSLYKLWQLLGQDKFASACAIMMFMVLGRTEELLWRTFSHELVSQGLMFAGIYFFYKDRFILAAFIFGLAANIDGIYSLLPMIYMLMFLLIFHVQRWKMFSKTSFIFILGSLPFLCWQIPRTLQEKVGLPVPSSEWLPLYSMSCPQNFLFAGISLKEVWADQASFWQSAEPYIFLVFLYIFLLVVSPAFRQDKKTNVLVWTAYLLIIFSTFFTYIVPSRFVIDLNLLRSEQFVRLFLMSYTTFWAVKTVKEAKPWQALIVAVIFLFIGFGSWSSFSTKFHKNIFVLMAMGTVFLILHLKRLPKLDHYLRKALIVIPLLGAVVSFCIFNYNYHQAMNYGLEPWQLLRNWVDMQRYVRDHTPKDALILTPIDTAFGGFRINSERKVVVCARDCGIIGFDYAATVEWQKRMQDMKDFVVLLERPINKAVLVAVLKYKVDYIVFMKYSAPQTDDFILRKIYQNEVFALFQVLIHPSDNHLSKLAI